MPSPCSARRSIGRIFRSRASPLSTMLVHGPRASCVGTTSIIATAASAMSARRSGMPGMTTRFWLRVMRCTPKPASSIRHAGPALLAIGRRSAPSRSTLNAIRSSRRIRSTSINSSWLHERGENYLDTRRRVAADERVLVTTLVKRMSEQLTVYLAVSGQPEA